MSQKPQVDAQTIGELALQVETYINETENIAVVKYEKDIIDEDEIRGMLS